MVLGDKRVADRALKLANQEMRREILPQLGLTIRPNSWNPLRTGFRESSPYGMKLWMQDKGALMILKNDKLLQKTAVIVVRATVESAVHWHPKPFVTNILDTLMSDG